MKNQPTIPQPKTYGPLGNIPLIDTNTPTLSLVELAKEFGPIFRFQRFGGDSTLMITGHELAAEVCDENRFDKNIKGPLEKVRAFAGDGLFTSTTDEPNWRKAHRILMPAFSQQAMKGYHPMMIDIALQLIQKWARLNPDDTINVPEDMTRLTLDTIGLCGFNYRFNSFYRENANPFIQSMVRSLDEAMHQGSRLPLQNKLMVSKRRQFEHDTKSMFALVDKIISDRKTLGDQGETDLLARMLNSRDPETGERLDDENIRYQMITFLIAGHETTSGLLSFTLYFLTQYPNVLKKACEEVERVISGEIPTYQQVTELKYIRMILNESLRLWPTAPAFSLYAKEDTVIGGKYPIVKGERLAIILPQLHRDKDAWGEDAEEFRPERFSDPDKIPAHAYKPFGNGQRACIGMQFAMHEAALVLGMVLKSFELIDGRNYKLKIKQTLTLKPDHFTIRVRPRDKKQNRTTSPVIPTGESYLESANTTEIRMPIPNSNLLGLNNRPLLVLYGSNMGTAEGIARALADTASLHGVNSEVAALNDRAYSLPKEGALIIVASSYNGKPTTNAIQFMQWLENAGPGEGEGVRYTVFGCGDRNWASTYQAVPRFIDEQLARIGAVRFSPRGEGDASADFEQQFGEWQHQMWKDAMEAFNLKLNENIEKERSTLNVQFVSSTAGSPLAKTYEAVHATVKVNRELQLMGSERSTRHLEILLPQGMTYQEGDHAGILPLNSEENVNRVLRRFKLNANDHILLTASGLSAAHLPLGRPVKLYDLLSSSVELQEPATRSQLRELAAYTVCPPHKVELEELMEEQTYRSEVLGKRITMLDLLEKYPASELPFERFLELLPALKPRYYSISSSPKRTPDRISITVAVVRAPARSGQGEHKGVASNFLAERKQDKDVLLFIRTPESGFQLPEDPSTPIVMVGPGTGIAPFRGFLQAREALLRDGAKLGAAHLYFGCRNELDYIYRDELEHYEQEGIVTMHTGFSRNEKSTKTYVQHLIEKDAELIIELLENGGHLYLCGDGSKMAPDVEATLCQAYRVIKGTGEDVANQWLMDMQSRGTYAKDVWAV